MSVELVMPRAGLTMVEGTVMMWKVEEGSEVKKGDSILEIENEKTMIDFECTADGFIHIVAEPGEVVAVGRRIGFVAETKEEYNELSKNKKDFNSTTVEVCSNDGEISSSKQKFEIKKDNEIYSSHVTNKGHVRATGLAKKMAISAEIDIKKVNGTGPNGRIVAKDIDDYINSMAIVNDTNNEKYLKPEVIPLTGIRRSIAKNMYESLQNMAQSSAAVEVDVTKLMEMKKIFTDKINIIGCKVTMNDILAMATVKVLKKHPLTNSTFDGTNITTYPYVNLSVAVGAENGLMVPVLKYADKMTLTQISTNLKDLVERAKEGKLVSDEQLGGTFTISNVGVFPIDIATPIINPPQVAIMGFGRSVKKMVIVNDEPCIRTMMNIFVTFDHRVLDGLEVGRIMYDMKEYLENPELIIV
ncbi:pyruvate/2-oxoglutarate dehydrogenase complex dihydrolipoamide acyltransferase (E2) component [Sedimentibacter acidaminivorans]|uniref:Dihydrolipoamide acetyltransferase component of pyruvate dehydrogenase complex n=1 Tax=Sedimentibacter acidaminivorans TaxID=913099 RepID=A0ABS4GHE7_9FIRM|nr:dihydrolipoamide acetyltransferase family protein [Sedimentibacter acidaminivorans]MBP1927106.1 pyruvate/2-oxoglutarate dehydrogenase complex dihydrolipoamide acyltransferase (E2) component [Sedimentibacter acidaminivorans]